MDEEKTTSNSKSLPFEESVVKNLDSVSTTEVLQAIGAIILDTTIYYNHCDIIEKWQKKVETLKWPRDDSGVVEHLRREMEEIEENSSDLIDEIIYPAG